MKTEPDPGEIIAALPYLVGFPPVDALIAVFLDSKGYLQMTARHDWDAIVAAPEQLAANLITYANRCDCSSVALIAVGPTRVPAAQESTLTDFSELVGGTEMPGFPSAAGVPESSDMQRVSAVMGKPGTGTIKVVWAVHSEADRWWSPDCHKSCGPRSHRVPGREDSRLVRRLRAEGRETAKTRQQIISEFDPASDSVVAAVEAAIRGLTPSLIADEPADTLALRISMVDRVELLLLADSAMGSGDLATLAVACQDIPMRDSLLRRFTQFSSDNPKIWSHVWPRINESLATAPDSHVAAVASVAGLFAWLKGDGIRAQAALDRALENDPGHNLAVLVHQAVAGGVPPSAWAAAMSDLTEADCMNGRSEDSRAA